MRRVLPVAVAAAALVAVPSTAFATAPQAPVENMFSASYSGSADFVLLDGRKVTASLGEYRGASQNGWSAALSLFMPGETCSWDVPCQAGPAWGDATLSATQMAFTRNLTSASALDVPMTLWTAGTDSLAPPTGEQVMVSLVFTGTGTVTRNSDFGDLCGDGSRVCQSHRLSDDRDATAELTLDGHSASGPGHLSFGLGTDTAAPKFVDGSP